EGRQQPRCGNGDIDTPRLVEQPLVVRVVDPGDDAGNPVLGLSEQRHDEVCLVVTGRGDDRVAALELCVVERADLARVSKQPLRPRHAVHLDGGRVLVDEQHFVAVLQQLLGDGAADGTRARYRDAHQWPALPGSLLANTPAILLSSVSSAITCTTSPSCRT